MQNRPNLSPNGHASKEEQIAKIIDTIESLQFGSVVITVQDGRIVQIEKTEKFRV